jgi:hypothetical protein
MEKQIRESGAVSESEKSPFKNKYAKIQINFEQCMDASFAFLSYFCLDELEYIDNPEQHSTCVAQSIKKQQVTELFHKILWQPTICSLVEGFIYHL